MAHAGCAPAVQLQIYTDGQVTTRMQTATGPLAGRAPKTKQDRPPPGAGGCACFECLTCIPDVHVGDGVGAATLQPVAGHLIQVPSVDRERAFDDAVVDSSVSSTNSIAQHTTPRRCVLPSADCVAHWLECWTK